MNFEKVHQWLCELAMIKLGVQVPAAYYAVLGGIMVNYGMSWKDLMHDLAKHNWITLPPPTDRGALNFWEVYELYDVFPWDGSRIAWMALLRQVPMAFALFSVVLFGSCLDITAIQANLPYEVCCCLLSRCYSCWYICHWHTLLLKAFPLHACSLSLCAALCICPDRNHRWPLKPQPPRARRIQNPTPYQMQRLAVDRKKDGKQKAWQICLER